MSKRRESTARAPVEVQVSTTAADVEARLRAYGERVPHFGPLHVAICDGTLDDEALRRAVDDAAGDAEAVVLVRGLLALDTAERAAVRNAVKPKRHDAAAAQVKLDWRRVEGHNAVQATVGDLVLVAFERWGEILWTVQRETRDLPTLARGRAEALGTREALREAQMAAEAAAERLMRDEAASAGRQVGRGAHDAGD